MNQKLKQEKIWKAAWYEQANLIQKLNVLNAEEKNSGKKLKWQKKLKFKKR